MDEVDSFITPEKTLNQMKAPRITHSKNGMKPEILKADSKMVSATLSLEAADADQSTQTPKLFDLDNVKSIGMDLATDVVFYVSKHKNVKPVNRHAVTMRRTVDELSEKHEIVFNSIVKKLQPLTRDSAVNTFFNVMEEMFRDGNYNWGRVVSVYAFGGRLAKYFVDNKMGDFVNEVAKCLGTFVADKLCPWIHQQGGWDAFDAYFPERGNMENVIWKSLVMTAVGLGALATMVAVR